MLRARQLRAVAGEAALLLAFAAPAAVAMRALAADPVPRRDVAAGRANAGAAAPSRGRVSASARAARGLVIDAGTANSAVRISYSGIAPGDARRTPVRVRNPTRRTLTLYLRTANVRDQPLGIHGGRLSRHLAFRMLDTSGRMVGGEATTTRRARVAVLRAGERRTLLLRMRFVDGGPSGPTTGDNAVQGAGAQVSLVLEGET